MKNGIKKPIIEIAILLIIIGTFSGCISPTPKFVSHLGVMTGVSEKDASVVANSFDYHDKSKMLQILTSLADGKAIVKLRSGFGDTPISPFEISTLKPPMKMH